MYMIMIMIMISRPRPRPGSPCALRLAFFLRSRSRSALRLFLVSLPVPVPVPVPVPAPVPAFAQIFILLSIPNSIPVHVLLPLLPLECDFTDADLDLLHRFGAFFSPLPTFLSSSLRSVPLVESLNEPLVFLFQNLFRVCPTMHPYLAMMLGFAHTEIYRLVTTAATASSRRCERRSWLVQKPLA